METQGNGDFKHGIVSKRCVYPGNRMVQLGQIFTEDDELKDFKMGVCVC